jgi:hypothetical protein
MEGKACRGHCTGLKEITVKSVNWKHGDNLSTNEGLSFFTA